MIGSGERALGLGDRVDVQQDEHDPSRELRVDSVSVLLRREKPFPGTRALGLRPRGLASSTSRLDTEPTYIPGMFWRPCDGEVDEVPPSALKTKESAEVIPLMKVPNRPSSSSPVSSARLVCCAEAFACSCNLVLIHPLLDLLRPPLADLCCSSSTATKDVYLLASWYSNPSLTMAAFLTWSSEAATDPTTHGRGALPSYSSEINLRAASVCTRGISESESLNGLTSVTGTSHSNGSSTPSNLVKSFIEDGVRVEDIIAKTVKRIPAKILVSTCGACWRAGGGSSSRVSAEKVRRGEGAFDSWGPFDDCTPQSTSMRSIFLERPALRSRAHLPRMLSYECAKRHSPFPARAILSHISEEASPMPSTNTRNGACGGELCTALPTMVGGPSKSCKEG